MTKHIVGIIIFTLIVGTSVVIAGLFGTSSAPNSYSFDKYSVKHRVYKKKKRKKRCRKKRRRHKRGHSAATVTQAIFDKSTDTLTTDLAIPYGVEVDEVNLHFFVKDEFGTQYLKKETVKVHSDNSVIENSFTWLNRLESRENLYVMPIAKHSRNWDYQPRFDVRRATPVLLKAAE